MVARVVSNTSSHAAVRHTAPSPLLCIRVNLPQMAGHLDFLTQELEASAYPALDALAKKVRQRTRGRGRGAGKGAATGQEGRGFACGARKRCRRSEFRGDRSRGDWRCRSRGRRERWPPTYLSCSAAMSLQGVCHGGRRPSFPTPEAGKHCNAAHASWFGTAHRRFHPWFPSRRRIRVDCGTVLWVCLPWAPCAETLLLAADPFRAAASRCPRPTWSACGASRTTWCASRHGWRPSGRCVEDG